MITLLQRIVIYIVILAAIYIFVKTSQIKESLSTIHNCLSIWKKTDLMETKKMSLNRKAKYNKKKKIQTVGKYEVNVYRFKPEIVKLMLECGCKRLKYKMLKSPSNIKKIPINLIICFLFASLTLAILSFFQCNQQQALL